MQKPRSKSSSEYSAIVRGLGTGNCHWERSSPPGHKTVDLHCYYSSLKAGVACYLCNPASRSSQWQMDQCSSDGVFLLRRATAQSSECHPMEVDSIVYNGCTRSLQAPEILSPKLYGITIKFGSSSHLYQGLFTLIWQCEKALQ